MTQTNSHNSQNNENFQGERGETISSSQNLPNYEDGTNSFSSVSSPAYIQEDSYPSNISESNSSYGSPYGSSSPNGPQSAPKDLNEPYADPYEKVHSEPKYDTSDWNQQEASPEYSNQNPVNGNYSNNFSGQPQPSELNIKALLGLIFSFVFFPVGLVLSWMGYNESKNTNDSTGKTLSLVGLIVSGIQVFFIVLWFVFFIFIIVLGTFA